ncbi:MAG: beta-aspartyl-dipeptidase (metallo-type) [Motiliproteus sp.]|jgi:beta-aspartyl-dipeptidase (metallo-type)
MLTLIKNVDLYSPQPLGIKHLLVAGERILAILDPKDRLPVGPYLNSYDAQGLIAVPGFVDSLVHFCGGGGEGGFTTRTPELNFAEAASSGTTTMVGALGTDAVTRTLSNLLAKSRELSEQGLTTYFYTGSYHFPATTLTGAISTDIIYIPEILGVGEIAIADHRGSQLSVHELARVTSEARVAGMIAGKKGIVYCHLGDGKEQLNLINRVVAQTDLPIQQFYPTHINRTESLLEAGFDFIQRGGMIDFTASTPPELLAQGWIACAEALDRAIHRDLPVSQISFSSDANASLPEFDAKGRLVGLKAGEISSLFKVLRQSVVDLGIPLEQVLPCVTVNPARILDLSQKGQIAVGKDADIVLIDKARWAVNSVWSRGRNIYQEIH